MCYSCILCTDPLATYPSAKQLSNLQTNQWHEVGIYLRLTKDQLEEAKKNPNPTASVLMAAKGRNIDMQWGQIVEALLRVGEYELAKSICDKEGELVSVCVGLCVHVRVCVWGGGGCRSVSQSPWL